jgi:lactate dehydrogenase-like 2-hydroxyacid dehydrogenase
MSTPDLLLIGHYPPPVLAELERRYTVHKYYEATDKDAMLAALADRLVIAATHAGAGFSARMMTALPKLKLIANLGVGYDNVDVPAAKARGIAVTNTPDVLNDDVADVALALLLAAVRRVPQSDAYVRTGAWATQGPVPLTQKVTGRRLGIVGLGRIGTEIANRAAAFKMSIAWHGPRPKPGAAWPYQAKLVDLAAASDFLVVACPGGAATANIVNAEVLAALGPDGWLVNIARGSVVDEAALLAALRDRKIAGAGLDVFATEPKVPADFFGLDNVVLLPHIGSATHETRRAMGQLVLDNLAAQVEGRPLLTPVP